MAEYHPPDWMPSDDGSFTYAVSADPTEAGAADAAALTSRSVLQEAADIVGGDRQDDYGHPQDNHRATADLWNAYLRRKYGWPQALNPRDVCMMNALQKISRDANTPKRDNLVDVAGYMANAELCDE